MVTPSVFTNHSIRINERVTADWTVCSIEPTAKERQEMIYSFHLHVGCKKPIRAFLQLKRYLLPFFERTKTILLNCAEMDKDVLAGLFIAFDKPKSFYIIEPLHPASRHGVTPYKLPPASKSPLN